MRSIPFKIICILGFNDTDYPKIVHKNHLDLTRIFPRKGDRSRRDDDRYMFLEAILSAKEKLYISYVGKDIYNNTQQQPSVLLNDLLEYCEKNYNHDPHYHSLMEQIVHQEPLQPYSDTLFIQTKQPYDQNLSFKAAWIPHIDTVSQTYHSSQKELPFPERYQHYDGDILKDFYQYPCEFFIKKQLGAYWSQPTELMSNEEPFNLGALKQYQMLKQIIEQLQNNQPIEKLTDFYSQSGVLPRGQLGSLTLEQLINTAYKLVKTAKYYQQQTAKKINYNITLDSNRTLQGTLSPIYQNGVVTIYPNRFHGKHFIASGIDHLIYNACHNTPTASIIIGLKDNLATDTDIEIAIYQYQPITQEAALTQLNVLDQQFYQGLKKPLPLAVKISYLLYQKLKKNPPDQLKENIILEWIKETSKKDNHNRYIKRLFPELDKFYEHFFLLSSEIYFPIFNLLELLKKSDAAKN